MFDAFSIVMRVVKFPGNIGSGNILLPDGTKPLPEPMLTVQIELKRGSVHDCVLDLDVVTFNENLMRCDTRIPFVPEADALEDIGWRFNVSYCQNWQWVFRQPFAVKYVYGICV